VIGMSQAIEISGLIKTFGHTRALDGLDLEVRSGEVHAFLGPNGSGKSTTLRVLLGLLRADAGTVHLLGGDPWRDATTLHRRLAYVPGDIALWPNLTGGDASGLRMETLLPWSALGFSGPTSLGFHVASSNGANLPAQLDDNMTGPAGSNFLLFTDHRIEKTATVAQIASGQGFSYALTLRNLSATGSANITVRDALPIGVTYVSYSAPGSSTAAYDAGTRTLSWYVPSIGATSSATLTLNVVAGPAGADNVVINTAQITNRDANASNNSASAAVNVIAAAYRVTKTVAAISDPISGASNPRSIPGAISEYTESDGHPSAHGLFLITEWFAQDTWKIRRNLTLTLGLRYQLDGVPYKEKANF